jgi:hypothetical protein
MPSCELAVVLLAALGVLDITSEDRGLQRLRRATWVFSLVLMACAVAGYLLDRGSIRGRTNWVVFLVINLVVVAVAAALLLISRSTRRARAQTLVVVTLVAESLLWFIFPTLQAPTHISVDEAPIRYLQQHQGLDRFLDLSVLHPNWGTEFHVYALNAVDLPFPKNFADLIEEQLYPGLHPTNAFTYDNPNGDVAQEQELAQHFRAYEDASVKYVLAPRSLRLLPSLTRRGVRAVFQDATATIYELPSPRPFFTVSQGCTASSHGVNEATVRCNQAGATLTRRELSMQGWSATVNGAPRRITTIDGVYQRVTLPKGLSIVRFQFFPPDEVPALVVALLAGLFLLASVTADCRSRRSHDAAARI